MLRKCKFCFFLEIILYKYAFEKAKFIRNTSFSIDFSYKNWIVLILKQMTVGTHITVWKYTV